MDRVLLIGYDYYHYAREIVVELRRAGFAVDFYPIEPKGYLYKLSRYGHKIPFSDFVLKPIVKLMLAYNRRCKHEYYMFIIDAAKGVRYDYVFFLTTLYMPVRYIQRLRDSHPDAEFIAYHWDSIGLHNNYLDNVRLFDRVFSFDSKDCARYGLNYLPLFASGVYGDIESCACDIDVYSIGTVAVLNRYILAHKFKSYCESNGVTCYLYLKVTFITYFRLLLHGVLPKDVHFKNIDEHMMRDVVSRSCAALDVPNHNQSGLTMRVIENMCIGKKLITTNVNIVNEPFYDGKQVFIIDMDNITGLKEFLTNGVDGVPHPELKLQSWLARIFTVN